MNCYFWNEQKFHSNISCLLYIWNDEKSNPIVPNLYEVISCITVCISQAWEVYTNVRGVVCAMVTQYNKSDLIAEPTQICLTPCL